MRVIVRVRLRVRARVSRERELRQYRKDKSNFCFTITLLPKT